MAGADLTRQRRGAAYFPNDVKCFSVDEAVEQLSALHGSIFIKDDHCHVFNVVIEGVAERDHLDKRREEHEKERHRVAQDDDEFFEKNSAKAAERASHGKRSAFLLVIPSREDGEGSRSCWTRVGERSIHF